MVNLTLVRSPHGPNYAKFRVPLFFSKLDLRDYLWHVYRVGIQNGIRSFVKQQRVQSGKPNEVRPAVRRWHRPRAHKFMIVELVRPFVWPEKLNKEELKAFNRDEVKQHDEEQEDFYEKLGSTKDTVVNKERRERMREQAEALLKGEAKWKPPVGSLGGGMSSRN